MLIAEEFQIKQAVFVLYIISKRSLQEAFNYSVLTELGRVVFAWGCLGNTQHHMSINYERRIPLAAIVATTTTPRGVFASRRTAARSHRRRFRRRNHS